MANWRVPFNDVAKEAGFTPGTWKRANKAHNQGTSGPMRSAAARLLTAKAKASGSKKDIAAAVAAHKQAAGVPGNDYANASHRGVAASLARKVRAKKETSGPSSPLMGSNGTIAVPSVKAHLNRAALKQAGMTVSKVKVDQSGNASFIVQARDSSLKKKTFGRDGSMTVEDQPRDEMGRWV